MRTLRELVIMVMVSVSCGCANVATHQAECEKQYSTFPEMVTCLKSAIAQDTRPGMSSNARVKLYLLKSEKLSQQVQKGEMSDLDARVALQELYVALKRDEKSDLTSNPSQVTHNQNCQINCTVFKNGVCQDSYQAICR